MGSITLPTMAIIAAAGTAVSAGVAAYSAHEQGVAQANVAKQKATQEALTETGKQITMRQNMLRALASQNAGTLGAVGTGGATSFGANARRQINQSQNDLLVSNANKSAQISLLDQSAKEDAAAGNLGALGDIVGGASKIAGSGVFGGGGGGSSLSSFGSGAAANGALAGAGFG